MVNLWSHLWPYLVAFTTAYAILYGAAVTRNPHYWLVSAFCLPERRVRLIGGGLLLSGLALAVWAAFIFRFAGIALFVYTAVLVAGIGLGVLLGRTSGAHRTTP
jgi:hypothetical protein